MEIYGLPEECISLIISSTSPRDACRWSLVSLMFKSASESDVVWEKFLPSDYRNLISQSVEFPPEELNSMPKKSLYFHLCQRPIIIADGKMSFSLEKESGKKCFMIGSRGLHIIWGDTPNYWAWKSLPLSRFAQVAQLNYVWWLDISATFETRKLSPETTYGAYFVYKFAEREGEGENEQRFGRATQMSGFDRVPVQFRVNFEGRENAETRAVFLDPRMEENPRPRERGEGWMEVEMGDFFNECGDDGSVFCGVKEVDDFVHKSGLIVEGIEIRPKS